MQQPSTNSNSQSPHPTFNMSMASVAQSFQQNSKNVMLGMRNINTKNSPLNNNNNKLAHDVCLSFDLTHLYHINPI